MEVPRRSSSLHRLLLVCVVSLLSAVGLGARADASDTQFHLRWAWSVAGSGIGYKGLEVVDLDSDGRAEILVAADPWESGGYWYILERQGDSLVQVFSSLPRADGVMGVATGVDTGGVRIVVAGTSSLSVYDGATRRDLASFPGPSNAQETLAVGDVDADGVLDAVVCDAANLYVYELLLGTVRTKFGFGCVDIAIGQTDRDPQLEIAIAGNAAGGFILDGLSLLVRLGRRARLRLPSLPRRLRCRRPRRSRLRNPGGVRVQDPASGALLWEEPPAGRRADCRPAGRGGWRRAPLGRRTVGRGLCPRRSHFCSAASDRQSGLRRSLDRHRRHEWRRHDGCRLGLRARTPERALSS